MEQETLLSQLSREELYAIYQFLLLESRSPQEIPRNAQKDLMLGQLAQTLSSEEAHYCLEFFENYEFYEVPVLKWEMIDALPDDLLCALHSIYLDSIDFPETHQELVDSLSQSNYFLKEDARKFYLWFHYFRERILWEDTAAAQPGYNATMRFDLEEMGVAESFTMENYGDLLAEDAGLSSAPVPTQENYGVSSDAYSSVTPVHSPSYEYMDAVSSDDVPSSNYTVPLDDDYTLAQSGAYDDVQSGAYQEAQSGGGYAEAPYTRPMSSPPPVIGKSEPELTPLQQKLMASLQGEKKEVVNQTIEINSFNLEAYILEQQEEAANQQSTPKNPTLNDIREQIAASQYDNRQTMAAGPPPVVPQGPSVIVDIPSEVVNESIHQLRKNPVAEPPSPSLRPPVSANVRSTMILDASAIIPEDMQELFASEPGTYTMQNEAGRRPAPPPPPPPGRRPNLADLKTLDLDSARDLLNQEETYIPDDDESIDDSIEELEPIDGDDDEILEAVPLASSDALPAMDPGMGPIPGGPQPPLPPPAPPRKKRKPTPRVPVRTGASLAPEQLQTVTTVLYRTALLGATYARPQIRAIRIFIQKILECSPEQLRSVRDILKRLQAEDFPLIPPPLDLLGEIIPIIPYAARLQLVHSAIFLLGCKTLQNLERYRDFLIDLAVELKLDPADISLFDLFGIVEEEIQLGVKDCLELFGLDEDASEGVIRKAHRAKVRLYHPDQYHAKGPEFVRLAERKMKESNIALEILLHRNTM